MPIPTEEIDQHSTRFTRLPDLVYISHSGLYLILFIPYFYRDFQGAVSSIVSGHVKQFVYFICIRIVDLVRKAEY